MGKEKKEIVSFDIVLRLKKSVSLSKKTKDRIKQYTTANGLDVGPFIEKELIKWMKAASGIASFNELVNDSELKEEEFMYRFNEFLERLGLKIPKNTFSPNFEERINMRLDRYEKGRR